MIILYFATGRTFAGRNGYINAEEGWRKVQRTDHDEY